MKGYGARRLQHSGEADIDLREVYGGRRGHELLQALAQADGGGGGAAAAFVLSAPTGTDAEGLGETAAPGQDSAYLYRP